MKSLQIDARKYLYNANANIEKNIDVLAKDHYGLCSQNILAQTRNLLEAFALIEYYNNHPNCTENSGRALFFQAVKEMKADAGRNKWFIDLYEYIEKSSSHLTQSEYDSEVLLSKYLYYMKVTKHQVKKIYGIDILSNIYDIPFAQDTRLNDYYDEIYYALKTVSDLEGDETHIYYIEKKTIKRNGIFEYVLSPANDKRSKYDRLTAFSFDNISIRHSISCSIVKRSVSMFGFQVQINIINGWNISIRPCEIAKLARAICYDLNVKRDYGGYNQLMSLLKQNNISLYELVTSNDFEIMISSITIGKEPELYRFLRSLRNVLDGGMRPNTIRYLLFTLRHSIIKAQLVNSDDVPVEGTKLSKRTYGFETHPFTFSLVKHNPELSDLLECFPTICSEDQLLKRQLVYNTENSKKLFTPIGEIEPSYLVEELVKQHNSSLISPLVEGARICYTPDKEYLYIKSYRDDTTFIIKTLLEKSKSGYNNYSEIACNYIKTLSNMDIDEGKIAIIKKAFISSSVLLINGAAGTGKTTLIKHFSNMFKDTKILFLSCTHTAVENLKRKIGVCDSRIKNDFMTLEKYKNSRRDYSQYKILVVDECSMVENALFKDALSKGNEFGLLILVGDEKQIESIRFGNWFGISNHILKDSSYELTINHRTESKNLQMLWEQVRTLEEKDKLVEAIMIGQWHSDLDESIFNQDSDDEIILCLNYDGLYGINNINKYMQERNANTPISWKVWTFKKNDKILFNDSYYFKEFFYNNQKGIIDDVKDLGNQIKFVVKVEKEDTNFKGFSSHIKHLSTDIKYDYYEITVDKEEDDDEEDNGKVLIVPFQLAYAVSIHKSQGLEYKSVKIILTKEIEESISHNIFYTAITRAKEKLKIYCDKTSLTNIVNSFTNNDTYIEAVLFKHYCLENGHN